MADEAADPPGYGYYTSKGAMLLMKAADTYNTIHKRPFDEISEDHTHETSSSVTVGYNPTPIHQYYGSGGPSSESLLTGSSHDEYIPTSSHLSYQGSTSASSGQKDASLLDRPIMSFLSNMVSPTKPQQYSSNRSATESHETRESELKKSFDPTKLKSLVQTLDNLAKKRSVSRVPIPVGDIPTDTAALNHNSRRVDSDTHSMMTQDPRIPQNTKAQQNLTIQQDLRVPQDVEVKIENVSEENGQLEGYSKSSGMLGEDKKVIREFFPNEYRTLQLLTSQLEALKQAKETVLKQLPASLVQQLDNERGIKPASGSTQDAVGKSVVVPETPSVYSSHEDNRILSLAQDPQALAGSTAGYSASGYDALQSGYETTSSGYHNTPSDYHATPSGYQATPSRYETTASIYEAAPSSYGAAPSGYETPLSGYETSSAGYNAAPSGNAAPTGYAAPSGYATPQFGHEASEAKGNAPYDYDFLRYESSRYETARRDYPAHPTPHQPPPQPHPTQPQQHPHHPTQSQQHPHHPTQPLQQWPQSRQDYEPPLSYPARHNVSPTFDQPPRPSHRDSPRYSEYPLQSEHGPRHPIDHHRPPTDWHRPPGRSEGADRSLEYANYQSFSAPVPDWYTQDGLHQTGPPRPEPHQAGPPHAGSPHCGPLQVGPRGERPFPAYSGDYAHRGYYPNHPGDASQRNEALHSNRREDGDERRGDGGLDWGGRDGDNDTGRSTWGGRDGDNYDRRFNWSGRDDMGSNRGRRGCENGGEGFIWGGSDGDRRAYLDGRGGLCREQRGSWEGRAGDGDGHMRHYDPNAGDRLTDILPPRTRSSHNTISRERTPPRRCRQDEASRYGDRSERKPAATQDDRNNKGPYGKQVEGKPDGTIGKPQQSSGKRDWKPSTEGLARDQGNKRTRLSLTSGRSVDFALLKGKTADGRNGENRNMNKSDGRTGNAQQDAHFAPNRSEKDLSKTEGTNNQKSSVNVSLFNTVTEKKGTNNQKMTSENVSSFNTVTEKKECVRIARSLWTKEMCRLYDEKNVLFDRLSCLRKSKQLPLRVSAAELKQIEALASEFKGKRAQFGEMYKNHQIKMLREHSTEKLNELVSKELSESKKAQEEPKTEEKNKFAENRSAGHGNGKFVAGNRVPVEVKGVGRNSTPGIVRDKPSVALNVPLAHLPTSSGTLGWMGNRSAGPSVPGGPLRPPVSDALSKPSVSIAKTSAGSFENKDSVVKQPKYKEIVFKKPANKDRVVINLQNKDIIVKKPEENSYLAPNDCPEEPTDAPYLLGAFLRRLQKSQLINNSRGADTSSSSAPRKPDGPAIKRDPETMEYTFDSNDESFEEHFPSLKEESTDPEDMLPIGRKLVDSTSLTNQREVVSKIMYDTDGGRIHGNLNQIEEEVEMDESKGEVAFSSKPVEQGLFSRPSASPCDSRGGPHREDTSIVPLSNNFEMIRDFRSNLKQSINYHSGKDKGALRVPYKRQTFSFPWETTISLRDAQNEQDRTLFSETSLTAEKAKLVEVLTGIKQETSDNEKGDCRRETDASESDNADGDHERKTFIIAANYKTPPTFDPFS